MLRRLLRKFRRKSFLAIQGLLGRDIEWFSPHGVMINLPAGSDLALRYLLAKGRPYEAPEAEMIKQYLRHGTNVIELGGCVGVISALIRSRIGPESLHIIVEAIPKLAALCEINARQNALPARTTVLIAAVDYSGENTISFAAGHNAHVGHVARANEAGLTVPTIRLSDLVQRLPEGPYALVCDIEGAEIALFNEEWTALKDVSLLVLETHPQAYSGGTMDLDRMMRQIGAVGLVKWHQSEDVVCFGRPLSKFSDAG